MHRPQHDFVVDVYSHYFKVLPVSARSRQIIVEYLRTLVEMKLTKSRGKWSMQPDCTYAAKDFLRGRYHLHINVYDEFMLFLEERGIQTQDISVTEHGVHQGVAIELAVVDKYKPYENQLPIIQHCLTIGKQSAVTSQPGSGKTAMFCFVAEEKKVRFAVKSQGGYASRWEDAFVDYYGWEKGGRDYVLACGAKALRKLVKEVREGKRDDLKAVYISNGAIRDFIKDSGTPKHDTECGGMLNPEELYEVLGIGLIGVDEAHKEIHANVIADLYTNVACRICLTATLLARDDFTARVYEMYLPKRYRRDMGAIAIYVDAYEILYNLAKPKHFDRVVKQTVYSHNEFERTIMKDKQTFVNYMDALYDYICRNWLAYRPYETKAILFCGLVDMCAAMTDYFQQRLPDLRVAQYNAGDDYDTLLDNDLITSTVQKAGTAVDIPNLSRVYNSTSVDSPNQLVQVVGRLRQLKHLPEEQCEYHQFVCLDIPKQMMYKQNRKRLLTPRVLSIREIPLGRLI